MANIIIIGNGPAGISTTLYTTRAGIDTTVIGGDLGAFGVARGMKAPMEYLRFLLLIPIPFEIPNYLI